MQPPDLRRLRASSPAFWERYSAAADSSAARSSPPSSGTRGPRLPYLAGLDGVRAVAVLAVLLYHLDVPWLPGGFLGVEVFFVLSGYLITALLLAEWRQHERIDFVAFWLRRARRLLPAVAFLLIGTLAIAIVVAPEEVARTRSAALAAATYVTNWYLVYKQESYFEAIVRPQLLQHLWSLAVEEQFYLLWPLILVGALLLAVKLGRRWLALAITLGGAVASTALMWLLYDPSVDPSRVYYGTDTRAAELLFGAALAFVWEPETLRSGLDQAARPIRWLGTHRHAQRLLDGAGVAAFAALCIAFWRLGEYDPHLYRGGFVGVALATALLIAVVAHPRARIVPGVLGRQPLKWIGLRSYSIYLWHWPIFMLTRPHLDIALSGLPVVVLRLGLTCILAEISYRYIETPFRTGAAGRVWRSLRESDGAWHRRLPARWAVFGSTVGTAMLVLGVMVVRAQPPGPPSFLPVSEIHSTPISSPTPTPTPTPVVGPTLDDVLPGPPPVAALPTVTPTPLPTKEPTPTPTPVPEPRVTAVGDSVMVGAAPALQEQIPNLSIDAEIGMAPTAAIAALQAHQADGSLGDVVVVHMGNNGLFTAEEFEQIMQVIGPERRAIFVNLKVPRPWEEVNNATIADGVARHPNAVLVDWHAASIDHPEFFWGDGIHLRPEGAQRFAELIRAQIVPPSTPSAGG